MGTQIMTLGAPAGEAATPNYFLKGGIFPSLNAQTALTSFTTAATAGSFSLPAGLMNSVGKTFRVKGYGTYTTSGGQTPQITVSLLIGASTVASSESAATTASATTMPFSFEFTVTTATVGTTGTDEAHCTLTLTLGTTAAVAAAVYPDTNTSAQPGGGYDHTVANAVAIQFAATSTLASLTLRSATLEILN